MAKRFVSVWLHHLRIDWFCIRQPDLRKIPFVLASPDHGRMVITATSIQAESQGIHNNMVVADARVIIPSLQVLDDIPDLSDKLLKRLAEWCIRFSPYVSIDLPDGLIFDATGCSHLWGGDELYLKEIIKRLNARGYHVRVGMSDTIGSAWAVARYGKNYPIIEKGNQVTALSSLPPAALRLEPDMVERLYKLGLHEVKDFITMPRSALRRRFGQLFIKRLDQAFGNEEEILQPVQPVVPYQERLPCLEPIVTLTGIEIALQRLLEALSYRLKQEGKGLRQARLTCYRVDGKTQKIEIGTNRPSHNVSHLFKLFEIKLPSIEPALGIELFTLEAQKVEDATPAQEKLWQKTGGLHDTGLAELLDRIAGRFGDTCIHRFLPDEHYWPERSFKLALSIVERPTTIWRTDKRRPLQLLFKPEPIEVMAPIPDYPPMHFRYKGKLHKIIKADGPERIEQEWWLQQGKHRDYYCVEDEHGSRYWLFRSGHYTGDKTQRWFIHGNFA